jgi:hypothetical protein
MVFTGSKVCRFNDRDSSEGEIISMESDRSVTIRWADGTTEPNRDPGTLRQLRTPFE